MLESENEEGWFWGIETHIEENGEMRKRYSVRYQNQRTETIREICRNWRNKHREQMKAITMKWRETHQENVKAMKQRYNQKHREDINKRSRKWARNNSKKRNKIQARYLKKHPEYVALHNHRRRQLGFVELNERFIGSEAHHLDKELVLYIPKELHQSIRHNVWNGMGMEEINNLACEYVYGVDLGEINRG